MDTAVKVGRYYLQGLSYDDEDPSTKHHVAMDSPDLQTVMIYGEGISFIMNEDRLGYVDPAYGQKRWEHVMAKVQVILAALNASHEAQP